MWHIVAEFTMVLDARLPTIRSNMLEHRFRHRLLASVLECAFLASYLLLYSLLLAILAQLRASNARRTLDTQRGDSQRRMTPKSGFFWGTHPQTLAVRPKLFSPYKISFSIPTGEFLYSIHPAIFLFKMVSSI